MADTLEPSFDFLSTFIEQLFDSEGFASLDEITRQQYIPQFVAEAERRLGLALMPLINDASVEELAKLVEGSPTGAELNDFWKRSVPEFDDVVKVTLNNFAKEMKDTLGTIRKA